ncbi:iron-containing alcohol dehydrogenase [Prochlorococcus sp. MIT 1223]|uniref:iron-containing alcohol dehydrogenase n=1 Tax=Prochlorococcus sp. MIT 1223 TaxID=3096217 RepID=UPI002A755409|nr:iron-containing alcohol dehydrogenase [Prochlorococcus sp. MIT 1223]
MSPELTNSYNSISPNKVFRGDEAWKDGMNYIPLICKSPLLLGKSNSTYKIRQTIYNDLKGIGINPINSELEYGCCEEDLQRISNIILEKNCDSVIAAGGGKVLDSGKLLADRLSLPCITIPLSAATCAGWTSLSNIYTKFGAFINDKSLKSCPNALIFDHGFVKSAPKRLLASGIADGLAKWYEASLTSSRSNDGFVQQALQMARVLRDQLFIDGLEAYRNAESDSWVRVAEACALTAGLIGGIGGARCRTAAAHPIHNGLTQLESPKMGLHGEVVGFGIIIQLHLEERYSKNKLATQAKGQLIKFLKEINLPTTGKELGIENISSEDLQKVSNFSCNQNSEIHLLPFKINKDVIKQAIMDNISEKTFGKLSDIKIQ